MNATRPLPSIARHPRRALCAASALAALAGCADRVAGPPAPSEPRRALTAAEAQTVRASNGFAFDMLRALGADPDVRGRNFVISPYSGAAALGMTLNGADGTTLSGMQRTLGLEAQPVATSNAAFRALTTYLLGADPAVTVRSANSVWAMTGFPIRPEFADVLRANFDAEARTVTFGTAGATQAINAWASDKTGGLIPTVFEPGQPDENTVALVVNALYQGLVDPAVRRRRDRAASLPPAGRHQRRGADDVAGRRPDARRRARRRPGRRAAVRNRRLRDDDRPSRRGERPRRARRHPHGRAQGLADCHAARRAAARVPAEVHAQGRDGVERRAAAARDGW